MDGLQNGSLSSPLMVSDSQLNGNEGSNNSVGSSDANDPHYINDFQQQQQQQQQNQPDRKGTLSSASFNILSTMVGGGSLSLPLAFHQAGKGLVAPLLLIGIAFLVQYSIHLLIQSSLLSTLKSSPRLSSTSSSSLSSSKKGNASYESTACSAFGTHAKYFSMGLVSTICFFTIVGYGVLLRDMLLPLADTIFPPSSSSSLSSLSLSPSVSNDDNNNNNAVGPTLAHNITLLFIMLLVTPLCTLRNLTALESVGAASMMSIFILACCISYRSIECNFSSKYDDKRQMPWYDYITYLPPTSTTNTTERDGINDASDNEASITAWDDILNALPILISVFMCHFNVLPVHNELSNPIPKRVNTLFYTTIWGACVFYLFIGFTGSMYGNCTPNGIVEGNVLLSFDEDDVLLMIGRVCLSLTITFAFPVLVVPARDTLLRGVNDFLLWKRRMRLEKERNGALIDGEERDKIDGSREYRIDNDLSEPLLDEDDKITDQNDIDLDIDFGDDDDDGNEVQSLFDGENKVEEGQNERQQQQQQQQQGDMKSTEKRETMIRIVSSIGIFWTGAILACNVKDIDIVWDFLGGSLSLIMGFTIPSGCFLVLTSMMMNDDKHEFGITRFDNVMAWVLLITFIPVMFLLTGNTVYNLGL